MLEVDIFDTHDGLLDPDYFPADYGQFYTDWKPVIQNIIKPYGLPEPEAQDFVHDVIIRFMERDLLSEYDPTVAKFSTATFGWIYKYCNQIPRRLYKSRPGLPYDDYEFVGQDGIQIYEPVNFRSVYNSLTQIVDGNGISRSSQVFLIFLRSLVHDLEGGFSCQYVADCCNVSKQSGHVYIQRLRQDLLSTGHVVMVNGEPEWSL